MVKKKATRARQQERETLISSARAAYIDSTEDDDDQQVFDIHVPKESKEISKEEQEFNQRRQNAKLTAKQKKRIQVLKLRKEKKQKREELYASLAKNQLSDEHIQILQSSARLGQKDTEKQKLKRALKKNRLGIATPDVSIFQKVDLPEFV